MRRHLISIVVLIIVISSTKCMEIYMKRSEIDDQASSGSSYSYQTHSGEPLSYSTYTEDATGGNFDHFGYPPITVERYTQELPLQLPLSKYVPGSSSSTFGAAPLNSYGFPVGLYVFPQLGKGLGDIELEHADYSHIPIIYGPEITRYGTGGVNDNYEYIKGGGSNYGAANHASHGEKGEKGYKNLDEYSKGAQGKHENEDHKGYYNKEGGNLANHHDVGEHYNKKEVATKSANGGTFKQSSSHKKGSKTTGYHKVHHKDEYKKDHSFYDESDNSGHFQKYGDFDAKQSNEGGKFSEGGHLVAGHDSNAYGNKGFADKGRFIEQNSGYQGKQGKEAHYNNFDEYAKNGGQQASSANGYSHGSAQTF